MHFADGAVPEDYLVYVRRKCFWIMGGLLLLFFIFIYSVSVGEVEIPLYKVIQTLSGQKTITDETAWKIIWNIRLPQALTAIVAGAGLSVAGVVMQSILRNPLGSPFTLGILNAGAFGAAFSIIVLGTGKIQSTVAEAIIINNPYLTTMVAFIFCLLATGMILLIYRSRPSSPEVMALAGIALHFLFTAGLMFLQYFADDTQLAAVVFWMFGDVGRANWLELKIMTCVVLFAVIFFIINRWNYNAIDAGDETAKSLGVNVKKIRATGMIIATLVTAVITSFLGIIAFVGLICPHMVRRIIGNDQRYLIPGSTLFGAIFLLASDTAARLIISPYVLPVSILTAFMGAPTFIYLLLRGYKR